LSWKCVCKEAGNSDENKSCKNCGRKRPKYLGVKLDLDYLGPWPEQVKVKWLMVVAQSYINTSDQHLEEILKLTDEYGEGVYSVESLKIKFNRHKAIAGESCNKCLDILKKIQEQSPDAQYEDDENVVYNINSIKSSAYFNIGLLYSYQKIYGKAIEYFQTSFDSDPNQVSIYNIAISTIRLPLEGAGGIFSGKEKKEIAMRNKRQQEIDLLKKTIKFYPFSQLAIKCGKRLIDKYNYSDFDF